MPRSSLVSAVVPRACCARCNRIIPIEEWESDGVHARCRACQFRSLLPPNARGRVSRPPVDDTLPPRASLEGAPYGRSPPVHRTGLFALLFGGWCAVQQWQSAHHWMVASTVRVGRSRGREPRLQFDGARLELRRGLVGPEWSVALEDLFQFSASEDTLFVLQRDGTCLRVRLTPYPEDTQWLCERLTELLEYAQTPLPTHSALHRSCYRD